MIPVDPMRTATIARSVGDAAMATAEPAVATAMIDVATTNLKT